MLSRNLGEAQAKSMRYVFQLLLSYWSWLKRDSYWKRGNRMARNRAKDAIRTMLGEIKHHWPRTKGNGWCKAKFHEQMHVPDDIERNGAHANSHSGPQEHNHILNVKKPSQRTQKRKHLLDWQIGNRYAETNVIETAHQKTHMNYVLEHVQANESFQQAGKGTLLITTPPDRTCNEVTWHTKSDKHIELDLQLLRFLRTHVRNAWMADKAEYSLPFFTEYNRAGTVFRCHPSYRDLGPWFDWVMVRWDPSVGHQVPCGADPGYQDDDANLYVHAPAKILMFVEKDGSYYAVIHGCGLHHTKSSVFSTEWELEGAVGEMSAPPYHIVSVDAIVRHCLMVPEHDGVSPVHHEVWERERWANEFMHTADME